MTALKIDAIAARCTEVADEVVPEYRGSDRGYSCTGGVAKRWQAAWDGACVALGHDPKNYRLRQCSHGTLRGCPECAWLVKIEALKTGDACEFHYPARSTWLPGTVVEDLRAHRAFVVEGLDHSGFRGACDCGWRSALNYDRAAALQRAHGHVAERGFSP